MKSFLCKSDADHRLVCTPVKPQRRLAKAAPAIPSYRGADYDAALADANMKAAYQKGLRLLASHANAPSRFPAASASSTDNFLQKLSQHYLWTPRFHDCFKGCQLDSSIWNITENDSTGGFNASLQAYNNNATNNIEIDDGKLILTARPEWYVQPVGCKNICVGSGDYEPYRVARPYTSGAINTHGKVSIDWSRAGYIEFKFRSSGGAGSLPTCWVYSENGPTSPGPYGGWSGSGEIDIMEIWHGPVGIANSIDSPYNCPHGAIWFGGSWPNNALLFSHPTISDVTGTGCHTVQFSWDAQGTFIWKFDGVVNFIVGPSNYQVRFDSSNGSPLLSKPYGNYISIAGDWAVMSQPYQGVYVGYDNGAGGITTTNPSPSPFDASNPYFLMIELQVGGSAFQNLASDNGYVFGSGYGADLSATPDGVLSDAGAAALGLPPRPSAYFTTPQTFELDYVKYMILK